jgi:GT2 family glycosyltransferase
MSDATTRSRPAIVGLEALTGANGAAKPIHNNGSLNGSSGGGARPWKVAAVIPCFNRRADLQQLLRDVARQDLRPIDGRPIQLWCVIVDNASTEPLATIGAPHGVLVDFVRLEKNSGGSGGFNAGMSHVLSGAGLTGELGQPDFIWWLDSDARAGKKCLRELVKVLARHPGVGGVGSALGDIPTGMTWETGARVVRATGYIKPCKITDMRFCTRADYLAACSGLVRRDAVERTGLFPKNFIYYDDIDWCVQMTAKTGLRVVGAPRSRAFHPPGNRRYVTWGRYYIARNCFSHIDALKLGGFVRFKRALRELPRAMAQAVMGIDELAELHLRGLRDALDKRFADIEPKDVVKPLGFKPFTDLKPLVQSELAAFSRPGSPATLYVHPLLKSRIAGLEAFRRELKTVDFAWPKDRANWSRRTLEDHVLLDFVGGIWRGLATPSADVAIVPTGWPSSWFRGKVLIQVTTEGLLVRRPAPLKAAASALRVLWKGLVLAVRIGLRGPHVMELPPAPAFRPKPREVYAPAESNGEAVHVNGVAAPAQLA